jgi:RNA polymerase sigma-70 factor (ECF subfamily)
VAPSLVWALPGRLGRPGKAGGPRDVASAEVKGEGETSVADLDENQLIEACLSGQAGAFDLVVERHRRSVYQLCFRFVGNHEDASDLSQDVFLRAFRGLQSFRGGSSLKTWLYRIGVNVCLNRVAVKKPLTEDIDARQHVDRQRESAVDRVLREERGVRVRAAIAQLPPKQRATLVLRMYQELSHEEIAGVLDSSVGAVKANFFHALGSLKKILSKDDLK